MKPAPFSYLKPESLEEAIEWLGILIEDQGRDAKVLAGGQSLVPLLNMRLARPEVIIDLNGLAQALGYVRTDGETLRIGAMTRHFELERQSTVLTHCPVIAEAERLIGHPQIRSRGTIGGSLVHADPSAELPLLATTLGARLTLQSRQGARVVAAPDFFVTYLTTDVQPTEILTEITFPMLPERSGQAIQEFAMRHGDFAIVAAAAQVTLDEAGLLSGVHLGIGGAGPVPMDVSAACQSLLGARPEAARIRDAMATLPAVLEPDDDLHASAEYRCDLAVTLGFRAVREAALRAGADPAALAEQAS